MLTSTDLKQISKVVKDENKSLETRINTKLVKIERKLDKAINFLDREHLRLVERVDRIEQHLGLEPLSQ